MTAEVGVVDLRAVLEDEAVLSAFDVHFGYQPGRVETCGAGRGTADIKHDVLGAVRRDHPGVHVLCERCLVEEVEADAAGRGEVADQDVQYAEVEPVPGEHPGSARGGAGAVDREVAYLAGRVRRRRASG